MRIGTYDGSVPKIRVTGNPLDYFELRFHNPDGIKNLRRLPGKSFSLDRYGIPTTRRAGVVQYIAGLYRINEALALAIRVRERPGLRNEVHNFLTLNRDLKLPEEDAPKKREETTANPNNEKIEIGTNIDTSPQSNAMRAALAQKRRDLCEFYLKFKFLHPLAMIGILSADPAYTATILSAENFGIKDKDPEVRLASVRILSEFVTNIWSRFKEAKESGTLPVLTPGSFAHLINAITFEDLNDDLQSLETISNAITQQGFGVFDKNSDVKSMAEIVAENIFKTQKIIRRYINEQGYSFSDNLTN
ncbi:MAG: hypothetical protein A3B68_07200 [Candidatus Melainabacteria bacterium RIFCSPHIGHO2_02_FULL_34_12]|nr:MAG: hypothetical protein A3B68_07200 [Candidatus Melainabacteria bacterium RIFCSPHIGHO2_02_FULL_34_12]